MKLSVLTAALALVWASASWNAFAGEGHDHGDQGPAVAGGNGPQRQADGSVFLPKPAQRQIGVGTLITETGELPRTTALAGKVVMDPNAGGKVQAMMAGRLEAGPHGLPSVGQTVKKGDVLAHVIPSIDQIERSNQLAQLAELQAARALAEKRLARLKELADTVPRKEIEAAESEVASLAARSRAIGGGLNARDVLTAPVSGVIASSNAVSGQVVDARELVFEIVDPKRLRIEALAYDPEVAADVASATLAVGEQRIPLTFIGAARILREQALPLAFTADGDALTRLAVGQPVEVYVQTRSTQQGVSVPAASVLKNPANQTIVWVKTAPERFESRTVTIAPLDGVNVAVTSGLEAGERVATRAATLINQIR
ncbi:efflux RND transporter periplasmic adaptor subunit (plasmid) [Thauera butanivorans]|uniref:efflux RND transporter periplasmic adaptor subunit n=1 Tax=Thauera butanivorans TaxID=86174 RepID=UPI003AB22015